MIATFAHLHGIAHRGWVLLVDSDETADRRKLDYIAVRDGERVALDWSPYQQYTERHFRAMVELGFPGRPQGSRFALFPADIDARARAANIDPKGGD